MQLRWSGHLVRMDDERLPKRFFYGDVATGSRRQGGQIRRYKDTLKSSLKCLQINPTNWEELALDRPTWRRTLKTGGVIYEANRIAAAKAKREARKSQLRPRLANQCLKHPPIPTKLVSTTHTALALSGIAWAYSATCASTTTCGRQPPATPHIHSLPTSSSTTITPLEINTHTPHAPNCHLPRKWEVRISTRSPCGFGCTGDLSPRLSRHVKRRG
nr:unnamed protein product [Spirometra erinaceieuropaei]